MSHSEYVYAEGAVYIRMFTTTLLTSELIVVVVVAVNDRLTSLFGLSGHLTCKPLNADYFVINQGSKNEMNRALGHLCAHIS